MTQRRFLSLWFPRLGAERCLRLENDLADLPFAILQENGQAQRLSSLSHSASLAGLYSGQSLRDAQAICPKLITRMRNIPAE
ncbi:MAG TPA: DNA methylase, partial [Rhodobacteraceae bacterium]|nr:DNA methylase [Paracoccaceae bacterium]